MYNIDIWDKVCSAKSLAEILDIITLVEKHFFFFLLWNVTKDYLHMKKVAVTEKLFWCLKQNKWCSPLGWWDFWLDNTSASLIGCMYENIVYGWSPKITNIELAMEKA